MNDSTASDALTGDPGGPLGGAPAPSATPTMNPKLSLDGTFAQKFGQLAPGDTVTAMVTFQVSPESGETAGVPPGGEPGLPGAPGPGTGLTLDVLDVQNVAPVTPGGGTGTPAEEAAEDKTGYTGDDDDEDDDSGAALGVKKPAKKKGYDVPTGAGFLKD